MFLQEKCLALDESRDKKRKAGAMSDNLQNNDHMKDQEQKRGRETMESTAVPGFFPISSKRFAGVTSYAGKILVNIREYYEKDGKMLPGSKGISLTTTQWAELKKIVERRVVEEAIGQAGSGIEGNLFQISATRKINVRLFGSNILVDIREYYEKDGQCLPGKKGISLLPDQWEHLVQIIPELDMQLERRGYSGSISSIHFEQEKESQQDTVPALADGKGDSGNTPVHDSIPKTKHQISSNRFVSLENWKGSDTIDIREYYEMDGEKRPGKKGITLSSAQARMLASEVEAISDALSKQDESFSLQLSSKRKVTISLFKGVPMVNVREYYEKDGSLLPTKKGISLPVEQWSSCKNAIENLTKIMNP